MSEDQAARVLPSPSEVGPPSLDRISDYAAHWAARHPDREALVDQHVRWTYEELQTEIDIIAAGLVALGVVRGDRVAMLGRPRPLCFAHFLAAASIGAVWVGLNPKYTRDEIADVVRDSRPRVLFALLELDDHYLDVLHYVADQATDDMSVVTESEAITDVSQSWTSFVVAGAIAHGDLDRVRAEVSADDAATMIYTSGTTGRSKGALVPHRGLTECGVVQAGHWYGDSPRKLCDLPLNHIGGLGDICTSILVAGGTVVFMEKFDPAEALRTVDREQLTHLYCIPTQLLGMVATPEWDECDLGSLEWILWGGAAAPLGLLEILAERVPRLGTSYSLTESTGSVTFTDEGDSLDLLTWSVGRVDPAYEVMLSGPDGAEAAPGESGEILIRGGHITLGYFERDDATREAIDADGWLHTGDLARIEDGGHLRLVGRLKEMYKSGGYNVYPREIEAVLEGHPAVTLASVVGVPDDQWGEVGHAFVVAQGVDADQLDAYLRERLANYKIPKQIWLEQSLPTLPVGKVDKAALRRKISS